MLDSDNSDIATEEEDPLRSEEEQFVFSIQRGALNIDYVIQSLEWHDFIVMHKEKISYIIETTFKKANISLNKGITNNISLTFVDDDEIRNINSEWRNKDKPTNVLSFPSFEREEMQNKAYLNVPFNEFGDIIIAWHYCQNEADNANISFEEHIFHMVIHGILHILGYDHINQEDALVMEALEVQVLNDHGMQNPYV